VVHLHECRKRIGASATFNRNKDLLRRLMHNHVIDDDLVSGRAKERGEFLVQAVDEITAFKVMKVAKLDIRL
jgi:hypothetical protein